MSKKIPPKTTKTAPKPPAKSPPKAGAARPSKAGAVDRAPGESIDPELQKEADDLVAFGPVRRVLFGDLRLDDNVRRIVDHQDQEGLTESIGEARIRERMTAYDNGDGTWRLQSGGRRYRALRVQGFPMGALIEINEVPKPSTRADGRIAGLVANVKSDMAWPDMALAIGEAVGVVDERGGVRPEEEVKTGRAAGIYKTVRQVAAALGKSPITIDQYVRTARAPYAELVQVYEARGSLAHGETYAKYLPEQRPSALAHFLKMHEWPVEIVPPRLKAPGAGRPTNESKGLPVKNKGGRADITSDKRRPPAEKSGKTEWTGGGSPPPVTPAPPPTPVTPASPPSVAPSPAPRKQLGFFEEEPASGPSSVAPTPEQRKSHEAVALADALGIPIELVVFLDDIATTWAYAPPKIETWTAESRAHIEGAIRRFTETDACGWSGDA